MAERVCCTIVIENDKDGTSILYDTDLDTDMLQVLLAYAYNQVSEEHERIQVH